MVWNTNKCRVVCGVRFICSAKQFPPPQIRSLSGEGFAGCGGNLVAIKSPPKIMFLSVRFSEVSAKKQVFHIESTSLSFSLEKSVSEECAFFLSLNKCVCLPHLFVFRYF